MRLSCYPPRNWTLEFLISAASRSGDTKLYFASSRVVYTRLGTRPSQGEVEHMLKLRLEPPRGKGATTPLLEASANRVPFSCGDPQIKTLKLSLPNTARKNRTRNSLEVTVIWQIRKHRYPISRGFPSRFPRTISRLLLMHRNFVGPSHVCRDGSTNVVYISTCCWNSFRAIRAQMRSR